LKRINVTIATDRSENVREIFERLNLPVVVSTGIQDDKTVSIFSALVPDELVDNSIDEIIKNIDLRIKENVISVYDVEAFVSTAA
jgi:hypothetical protein